MLYIIFFNSNEVNILDFDSFKGDNDLKKINFLSFSSCHGDGNDDFIQFSLIIINRNCKELACKIRKIRFHSEIDLAASIYLEFLNQKFNCITLKNIRILNVRCMYIKLKDKLKMNLKFMQNIFQINRLFVESTFDMMITVG